MTVKLVTDSISQIPAELRERFDVAVVPITIVIDGEPYREGIDLTTDEFYERLATQPTISTAAAPPGEVIAVYEAAAAAGATQILSIHTGSDVSATLNSVMVARGMSPVPVEVVDTGTASFAVACCVWAAGEALATGAGIEGAAEAARTVAGEVNNVFIVGAIDFAQRGGRLAAGVADDERLPVLALTAGRMQSVAQVRDVDEAMDAMTAELVRLAAGAPQRVGVGHALVPDLARAFADRLRTRAEVADLVFYDVGPSVGAHTGPGTLGACFFPTH